MKSGSTVVRRLESPTAHFLARRLNALLFAHAVRDLEDTLPPAPYPRKLHDHEHNCPTAVLGHLSRGDDCSLLV